MHAGLWRLLARKSRTFFRSFGLNFPRVPDKQVEVPIFPGFGQAINLGGVVISGIRPALETREKPDSTRRCAT
jgi:hypothetical protein